MRTTYYYFGEHTAPHILNLAKKLQEELLKENHKRYIEKVNPVIDIISGDTGEVLASGHFAIEEYTFAVLMYWELNV